MSSNTNVDDVIADLYRKFAWLSKKLETLTEDEPGYVKVIDAYQKVLKTLHDFLKLRGLEASEDDLAKLLEKIPSKHPKRVGKVDKSRRPKALTPQQKELLQILFDEAERKISRIIAATMAKGMEIIVER